MITKLPILVHWYTKNEDLIFSCLKIVIIKQLMLLLSCATQIMFSTTFPVAVIYNVKGDMQGFCMRGHLQVETPQEAFIEKNVEIKVFQR